MVSLRANSVARRIHPVLHPAHLSRHACPRLSHKIHHVLAPCAAHHFFCSCLLLRTMPRRTCRSTRRRASLRRIAPPSGSRRGCPAGIERRCWRLMRLMTLWLSGRTADLSQTQFTTPSCVISRESAMQSGANFSARNPSWRCASQSMSEVGPLHPRPETIRCRPCESDVSCMG